MRVTPNGASEFHNGNEIGRYGLQTATHSRVFVWYHDGMGEPTWAMDTDVEWKISVSVDTILVADAKHGLYAIDREAFSEQTTRIDGRRQCIAHASDEFVTEIGDPDDHLRGALWIESGNRKDTHYHQKNNHA